MLPAEAEAAGTVPGALPLPTEEQAPAVEGTVPSLPQQLHALQPGVRAADMEQQQPPRHKLVPQSKGVEQGSPGEKREQEPVKREQELQLARTALELQHMPPLQEEEEHWLSETQLCPGGCRCEAGLEPPGQN